MLIVALAEKLLTVTVIFLHFCWCSHFAVCQASPFDFLKAAEPMLSSPGSMSCDAGKVCELCVSTVQVSYRSTTGQVNLKWDLIRYFACALHGSFSGFGPVGNCPIALMVNPASERSGIGGKGRGDWHICTRNGTEAGREAVGVIREAALIPGFDSEHSPLIPSLYSQISLCL